MPYEYSFDETSGGIRSFPRATYEHLQRGLAMLGERISARNDQVRGMGLLAPFEREHSDVRRMLAWGRRKLDEEDGGRFEVFVGKVSVGSLRYLAAAARIAANELQERRRAGEQQGLPPIAFRELDGDLDLLERVVEGIGVPPADILLELDRLDAPGDRIDEAADTGGPAEAGAIEEPEYDVFIAHAAEDQPTFVRALAEALEEAGLRVWYAEFSLRLGDSLRRSIDQGLRSSRFGIVVLSLAFFGKAWPQYELDGLVEREMSGGRKVILPVWHEVGHGDVARYSPSLADKLAARSADGVPAVVRQILSVVRQPLVGEVAE